MFALSKVGWFLLTPSNLLLGLALLGLALALPRTGLGRRRALGLSAAAILLAGVLGLSPAGTWLLGPLEDRFPAYRDDGRPVSGVIVLGGAVRTTLSVSRGQLVVSDSAERVIAMADLARRLPETRIVFTGGGGGLIDDDEPEADVVRRFGGVLGIDPARLLYEDRSRTTAENATETRALLQPKAGERWLLVTSAWHMPRAVGCFREAGFAVTAYPVDYRTPGPGIRASAEAGVAAGLDRVDLATREWLGLLAYRLLGRTDALFPGP